MKSTGHEPTYTWSEVKKQIELAVKHDRQQRPSRSDIKPLTDDDLSDISDVATKSGNLYDLRLTIEAKLKEKNT